MKDKDVESLKEEIRELEYQVSTRRVSIHPMLVSNINGRIALLKETIEAIETDNNKPLFIVKARGKLGPVCS